jgi:lipid-A-disaccharide synthase
MRVPLVMMIAGETSGDHHGARVVTQMRKLDDTLQFCGIGGQAMAKAGVHLIMDSSEMAVVGITEVFAKIPQLRRGRQLAREMLVHLKPDLLILIDFPDFNLHTAAFAKKRKVPVLYYISPQIWAWRRGRVKKIKRCVDHMAVILPFEKVFYEKHGVPVSFVGHPLLDHEDHHPPPSAAPESAGPLTIGLLPGSREREVSMLLPPMVAAACELAKSLPPTRFVISKAPSVSLDHIRKVLQDCILPPHYDISADDIRDVLKRCRLVVAASGTVALDAALMNTPLIIIYKVSPLSYWLGRLLIKVKFICLVNLIAGKAIVPELIQKEVTAANITREIKKMLSTPQLVDRVKMELTEVCRKLGQSGAAARVANIALDLMSVNGLSRHGLK